VNRRSSRLALVIGLSLVWLGGCSSTPPKHEESAEPVRETQSPDAPPFGKPRPKIRPKDVVAPENEE
jgi:PBP1b-binding outer membrane lipoprotein LpoB